MRATKAIALCLALLVATLSPLSIYAAEPLLGRWTLITQEIEGRKTEVDELTLRILQEGDKLEFAYSLPVNDIQFVSLRYLVRPDGTEGEITNANGQKIGTVKVTRLASSRYRIVLQGANRPTATGIMTVSADGKTLTSESESKQPGQNAVTHMVQTFSRQ